jgi:hypothetical protein
MTPVKILDKIEEMQIDEELEQEAKITKSVDNENE